MGNPNCCFMIIAGTFFFSSQSPRGTVNSNVDFVRSFFGGNVSLKKSFRLFLTFSKKNLEFTNRENFLLTVFVVSYQQGSQANAKCYGAKQAYWR